MSCVAVATGQMVEHQRSATSENTCLLQDTHRTKFHKSMDFGKFYQTSYLDRNGNTIAKGSQSSPNLHPVANFHRPGESLVSRTDAGHVLCCQDAVP